MAEISLSRELRHPAERVWAALADPVLLSAWLGPTDLRPEVGCRFVVQLEGPPWHGATVRGQVLEVERGRRLLLAWHHGDQDTVVELSIEPVSADRTRLSVRQRGFRGLVGAVIAASTWVSWRRALAAAPGARRLPAAVFALGAGIGAGLAVWWLGAVLPVAPPLAPQAPVGASGLRRAPPRVPVADLGSPSVEAGAVPAPELAPSAVERSDPPGAEVAEAPEEREPRRLRPPAVWINPWRPERRSSPPLGELVVDERHPPTLMPVFAQDDADMRLLDLVYDPLFEEGPDGEIRSYVIASSEAWPSRAGIDLAPRAEVRWHDGAPLTARDICFTVEAWRSVPGPQRAWRRASLAGCEVDGDIARVALVGAPEDPRRALDLHLLPSHLFGGRVESVAAGHPMGWRPVGTGPFQARLVRNGAVLETARFGSRPAALARITLRSASSQRLGDLGRGVHILQDLPSDVGREVLAAGGTVLPGGGWDWLLVMRPAGPLSDVPSREALVAIARGEARTVGPATLAVAVDTDVPDAWSVSLRNRLQDAGFDVVMDRRPIGLRSPELLDRYQAAVVAVPAGRPSLGPRPLGDGEEGELPDGPVPELLSAVVGGAETVLAVAPGIAVVPGTAAHPYADIHLWRFR